MNFKAGDHVKGILVMKDYVPDAVVTYYDGKYLKIKTDEYPEPWSATPMFYEKIESEDKKDKI